MERLQCRIYIVDDEVHNLTLLSKLLTRHGFSQVMVNADPEAALLEIPQSECDLLLLDMTMPKLCGLELLEHLQPLVHGTPPLPVLVLTGDTRTDTRRAALNLGAKDFVNKPFDPPEVLCRIQNLLESRCLQKRLVNQNCELERLVSERTRQLQLNQLETVRRLGQAAEYRDDQTGTHIVRVSRAATLLAQALGQTEDFVAAIGHAAQLHDLGKLAIPDSILLKPGRLDSEEMACMRQHVAFGAEILGGSDCPILIMAEQIARYHHERWDGLGYLEGLEGLQIPLCARILSVVDVFDALTSERPYKRAWSFSEALAEIEKGRGSQFDPDLVDQFLRVAEDIYQLNPIHR
ncbi:MAG: response regulator [Vulcanimicrobiota bacterium]